MTKLQRKALTFLVILGMTFGVVLPPQPALADFPVVQKTMTITGTSTPVSITPLTGQSACTVEIVGTASGTTQVLERGTWVNVDSVQPSGTAAASPTVSGPGTFIANCAGMQGYQFVPTSVSGSATITVLANGGVGRILGAGVNGGRTIIAGQAPIVVTNAGNTATVSLTTPLAIQYGGTNNSSLLAGCLQSTGTQVISTSCPTPGATPSPVSVQAGNSNVSVATPSPGVFVVSAVTPTPIAVVAGNSNVTVTNPSPGVFSVSAVTPSPAPTASPVSVTGTLADGVVVTTPLPGVFNVDLANVPNSVLAGPLVQSLTAGSNVLLTGTASNPIVSAITPSPAPTLTAGNGIAITSNVVSNTGVLNILSGNTNMAVATSSPGVFTLTVATPSPAPTGNIIAGNGVGVSGTWPNITVANNGAITLLPGTNVTLATSSPGVYTINAVTPSPAPTDMPISVQPTTGITVATPSPGVFVVGNSGVLSLVAGNNIQPMTGQTPTVATTDAPTFSGLVTARDLKLTDPAWGARVCVQTDSNFQLSTISNPCLTLPITTSAFNLPAVGSTASVSLSNTTANISGMLFMVWNNSLTDFALMQNQSANGVNPMTLKTVQILLGTAGDSMPIGSNTYPEGLYYTAGSNVTITPTNGNVVAAITPSPAPTGNIIGGTGISTSGIWPSITVANTGVLSVTGSGNMASSGGQNPNVTITGAPTFAGQVSAASYKASNLTSGDCLESLSGVITSVSTSCPNGGIGGVTGSTNIAVTTPNPSSPTIAITGIIPVGNGGTGTGALNAGLCLGTIAGGVYSTSTIPCLGENTNANFTAPAVGSAVNVSITSTYVTGITQNHMPVIIDDGTTSFDGIVNSGAGTTTLNVTAVGYASGSPGAIVGAGAVVAPGGNGRTTVSSLIAGTNIQPMTGATPTVAETNAPTWTGTATGGQFIDSGFSGIATCVGANTSKQFVSGSNCVFSVAGDGGNITTTGGTSPTVSITAAPTFAGNTTVGNLTNNGMTPFQCGQANSSHLMATTNYSCGLGSDLWFAEDSGTQVGRLTTAGGLSGYGLSLGNPRNIALGPDGNVWASLQASSNVIKVTPSGVVTQYSVPAGGSAYGITAGPDGNMWVANDGSTPEIVKITLSGTATGFALTSGATPAQLTTGPDGNIWAVELGRGAVARVTPSGTVTEFSIFSSTAQPIGIATGPDGNLWVTLLAASGSGGNAIAKVSTAGVLLNTYALGTASSQPFNISAGPDGRMWFGELNHSVVGAITTNGTISEYATNSGTASVVMGPDGQMWFTEPSINKVGSISTTGTGLIDYTAAATPYGLVVGPGSGSRYVGSLIQGSGISITGTTQNPIISVGSTGVVQSITGSGNISVSAGPTPVVSETNAPTYTGTVTAGTFSGSGAGLTSGTVPNAALVTTPVTSITCTGNIMACTGTTPTVQTTTAPTFTNVTLSGATASQCIQTNGSKVTTSSGEACPVSFQGGTRLGGLHTESGVQNITTSIGSCVSGTPITFQSPFNALPNYQATSQAIVGTTATFATGSFSTTGITPALCSSTDNGTTMSVFWSVTGW